MIEEYAFKIGNSLLTFDTLKSSYGMFLRNIEDSGAVNWDIATAKNPYIDGVQVNNRVADAREITFEFGYDLSVEPEAADNALFSFLASAISSNGTFVTIKKTKGTVNKYINGYIQSINHLEFSEEPTLQIVFLTDTYWQGDEEIYNLTSATPYGDTFHFTGFNVKGHASPAFTMTIDITKNDTQANESFVFYAENNRGISNGIAGTLVSPVVVRPIAAGSYYDAKVILTSGGKASSYKRYAYRYSSPGALTPTIDIADYIGRITATGEFSFFSLPVGNVAASAITFSEGLAAAIRGEDDDYKASVTISYIPLYIR